VTIGRSSIRGGPANDPALAAYAQVIRWCYALGPNHSEAGHTDQERIDLFAAYLAGQGPPARPKRQP
jgi:hypothetical protein